MIPPLVPIDKLNTAAKFGAEPYEGRLVTVDGPLKIANENVNNVMKSDSEVNYELEVEDGAKTLRVQDFLFRRWGTGGTLRRTAVPAPARRPREGRRLHERDRVMGWSFSQRKLFPHAATDFGR